MDFNYELDTAIDPDDLVEEWLKLSSMFFSYSKELAKAEKVVKDAHEALKVTRSRLVKEIKSEEGKMTMGEVEAEYRTHPDHIKAKKDFIQAEYDRDLVKAAIGAFYRKETAMLEVGKLIGRIEHFRHPQERVDIPGGKRLHDKALSKASDQQAERLNQKRTRRTRRKD